MAGTVGKKSRNADRDALVLELGDIKTELATLLAHNETVDPAARLEQHEFIIDFQEQERIAALGQKAEDQVRHEIELEMMRDEYARDMTKDECWDSVKVGYPFPPPSPLSLTHGFQLRYNM